MAEAPGSAERELAIIDHLLNAALGRLTAGVSPAAVTAAWLDWGLHLASSPAKQASLVQQAMRDAIRFGDFLTHALHGPKA